MSSRRCSKPNWEPGDTLYVHGSGCLPNNIFELKSCEPDHYKITDTAARWSPDKG